MGCSGSKHYSDLSPKRTTTPLDELEKAIKGTTALAFFTKDGQIVVAVDSRASNEVDDDDLHGRALKSELKLIYFLHIVFKYSG